jgi:DNA-directed RNA polymerase subunit alpha
VVIEPFERGFGHTLGNALRRVLLSSMPGAAITEVGDRRRAARVHQHRGRAGGRRRHPAEPEAGGDPHALARFSAELRLNKKGPGPVTAGDIQTDHDVEIVNPELVIANLTQAGELNMTLKVERGRGYRPASAARSVRGTDAPDRPPAARCLVQPDPSRDLLRSMRRASNSAPTSTS